MSYVNGPSFAHGGSGKSKMECLNHFDRIAHIYDAEIPKHIHDLLVKRKCGMMVSSLILRNSTARIGIDIGCGHGHHVREMARMGYDVMGIDESFNQVQQAKLQNLSSSFACVDIANFRGPNLVDFAWAINVLHHISPVKRRWALENISVMIDSGGYFFLHEINTLNPLFRWYMNHIFPLLHSIDDGTEVWIRPDQLPEIPGGKWVKVEFFTWIPEWTPRILLPLARLVEAVLEHSPLKRFSAHYMAIWQKD